MPRGTTAKRGEDGLLPQGGKSISRSIPGWYSWCLHVAWAGSKLTVTQEVAVMPQSEPFARGHCARGCNSWEVGCAVWRSFFRPQSKRDRTDLEPGVAAFPQLECVWHSSVWRQLLGAVQSRKNGRAAPSLWHYLPCCPWFQEASPTPFPYCLFIFSTFRSHHLLYRNMKQQMIVLDTIVYSIVLLCPTLLMA